MRFQPTRNILLTAFGDVAVNQAIGKGCLIIPFMYICVTAMERSGIMGYTLFSKMGLYNFQILNISKSSSVVV